MLNLLWGAAVVLAVLWILGFSLNFTLGGFIHVLLVLAFAAVLIRIIAGRRHTSD
ncbi:MAG: lmo0937 family membrane protein [Myxococcales bacterium]|nr:lmo0937 family membrane protein [Myxococcales bacterium]